MTTHMHAGHDCDTVNKTKGILAYRKNYNERKAKGTRRKDLDQRWGVAKQIWQSIKAVP